MNREKSNLLNHLKNMSKNYYVTILAYILRFVKLYLIFIFTKKDKISLLIQIII